MRTDTMHVEVRHRFDADPGAVWDLLSDVELMAGLGEEHVEAGWVGPERGPGARFTGTNQIGEHRWEVPCTVVESDRPTRFGWVVGPPDSPSSTWTYDIEPDGSGTVVTQRFAHGPSFSFVRASVQARPQDEEQIVAARAAGLRRNMAAVLAAADRLLTTA